MINASIILSDVGILYVLLEIGTDLAMSSKYLFFAIFDIQVIILKICVLEIWLISVKN